MGVQAPGLFALTLGDQAVEALAAGADLPGGALVDPTGYRDTMRELSALPTLTGPAAQPPPSPWSVLAAVAPDLLKQTLLRQVQEAYDRSPRTHPAEAALCACWGSGGWPLRLV